MLRQCNNVCCDLRRLLGRNSPALLDPCPSELTRQFGCNRSGHSGGTGAVRQGDCQFHRLSILPKTGTKTSKGFPRRKPVIPIVPGAKKYTCPPACVQKFLFRHIPHFFLRSTCLDAEKDFAEVT